MLRFPTASRVRLTGATALAAALLLGGCAGGTTTESKDKGSATSGSITWWGWTPDEGPAKEYIKSFNKQYPDIKVTFKRLTIDGYNAAVRPALASSVGPDVYAVAPGSGNGPVQDYGTFAVDLTPAVAKKLGPHWHSKLAPIGVDGLTVKGKPRRAVGRLGVLRADLDQQGPLRQVRPEAAHHVRPSGSGCAPPSVRTGSAASSRAPPRPPSTRTRSRPSPTT